jgi:hypothetical protein
VHHQYLGLQLPQRLLRKNSTDKETDIQFAKQPLDDVSTQADDDDHYETAMMILQQQLEKTIQ